MKYENFEQAKKLVEQIEKHQRKLEELSSDRVSVVINYDASHGARIMTIGIESTEHEYATMAKQFVEKVKMDLKTRIETLKSMLETL